MKQFFLGAITVFLFTGSFAQQSDLLVKTSAKGLYLEHKASTHEGLFLIGRMYNVHPRYIAAYNNLDFNKGLTIGQMLKIPLTDTNFNQKGNEGLPVYYITREKETLANISIKNKMVPMSNLRNWNNISDDNLTANSKVIVGYLGVNQVQGEAAVNSELKNENMPAVTEEKKTQEVKNAEVAVIREEPKKIETEIKKEDPPLVKEEPKEIIPPVENKTEKPVGTEGGFFRDQFNEQIKQIPVAKEQTLTSSVFKTANGWQDAKYYLLIDGVEPGTIVKITNPVNNKIVFVKVLYGMEGIRQNEGLDMRISDAAAAALSIAETDKFILKINY